VIDKPILMNGSNVGAILAGRKSQTRRVSEKARYAVGDHLWLRETWAVRPEDNRPFYRATYAGACEIPWRPSIFMPRWASRLTLEVTAVRYERLQEISEADAIAEGITWQTQHQGQIGWYEVYGDWHGQTQEVTAVKSYAVLWDSINGKKHPWNSNPLVWCYEFKRLDAQEAAK